MSFVDIDVLARTLYGEAEAGNEADARAIAAVVLNRVRWPNWPSTIAGVCRQPWQFSCWNPDDPNRARIEAVTAGAWWQRCQAIAREAVSGDLADPTGGATHYYATWIKAPAWARGHEPSHRVEHRNGKAHLFFNAIDTPPPESAAEALEQIRPYGETRTARGGRAVVATGVAGLAAGALAELAPALPVLRGAAELLRDHGTIGLVLLGLAAVGLGAWVLHARRDDRARGLR